MTTMPADMNLQLFGIAPGDIRPLPRIPSLERGCTGKLQLGEKFHRPAERMARKHGKPYGVYRCPHCDGTHLTTKLEHADKYAPLLYIAEPSTIP